jgi:hypothetical protein
MSDEQEKRIRDRAYRKWQEEGCPEGKAEAHWEEASREVQMEGQVTTIREAPARTPGAQTRRRKPLETPDVIELPAPGNTKKAAPRRDQRRKSDDG